MGRRMVVLGLGSFGTALALRLTANGCQVTGVDRYDRRVEAIQQRLDEAIIADVTNRAALEELMLETADTVFISLGESIERSILATLHAKELGAPRVFVKGVSLEHGRILEKLGADRVIFPEAEMAEHLADNVSWPNVLDFLRVIPDYSIAEVPVPGSMVGQKIGQTILRSQYGVLILAVKRPGTDKLEVMPQRDFPLDAGQRLIVIGRMDDLESLRTAP